MRRMKKSEQIIVGTTIRLAWFEGKTICIFFSCLLLAIVCSTLVLLWAGSTIAQRIGGWVESGGSLLLTKQYKTLSPFLRGMEIASMI